MFWTTPGSSTLFTYSLLLKSSHSRLLITILPTSTRYPFQTCQRRLTQPRRNPGEPSPHPPELPHWRGQWFVHQVGLCLLVTDSLSLVDSRWTHRSAASIQTFYYAHLLTKNAPPLYLPSASSRNIKIPYLTIFFIIISNFFFFVSFLGPVGARACGQHPFLLSARTNRLNSAFRKNYLLYPWISRLTCEVSRSDNKKSKTLSPNEHSSIYIS